MHCSDGVNRACTPRVIRVYRGTTVSCLALIPCITPDCSRRRPWPSWRVLQSGHLECTLLPRDQVRAQWAQAFSALRDRALGMGDHDRGDRSPRSVGGGEPWTTLIEYAL